MNPPSIQIRPAGRADADFAAAMLQLSMGQLAGHLFGADDAATAAFLRELFLRNAGRFGSGIAFVAQAGADRLGALFACEGARVDALNLATFPGLVPSLGIGRTLGMIVRGLRLPGGREAERDEYYISNLGVPPAAQGRGIGSRLLAFAEGKARAANLGKCSLVVGLHNPGARRLYERLGYGVVETVAADDPALAYQRMMKVL